jgi:ATP/maltotriose-dependent transcriptional regulator MalT
VVCIGRDADQGLWACDLLQRSSRPSCSRLRPEQVPRPRLLEFLEAGSDRKLTFIGASTGYGKTTLLTQRRRSEEPHLNFTCVLPDEQDNDPIRLWKQMIAALRRAAPEEGFGADVFVGPVRSARSILEMYPSAGMSPELLERQERVLHRSKRREGWLDGEIMERELDVLRLLYVAPSTVRTHIKSIYRRLGDSSRGEAVEQAHAREFI